MFLQKYFPELSCRISAENLVKTAENKSVNYSAKNCYFNSEMHFYFVNKSLLYVHEWNFKLKILD